MKKLYLKSIGLLFLGFTVLSCQNGSTESKDSQEENKEPEVTEFTIKEIDSPVENPWGITWIDESKALITERSGKIFILNEDQVTDSITDIPAPFLKGQSGYLDIKAHPEYPEKPWIYLTYSKKSGSGGSTTLARFQLSGNKATNWEDLYQTMPITDAGIHFGSRIIFDNDGYLFFSTGERGVKENAQDLTNDMGKIHRLFEDGSIPEDNPFVDTPNAKKSIWTYGNRNVQGMTYDSENNIIYATEHGPKGGDELNVIQKGANYGWPEITYGIDYDGSIISDLEEKEGLEQPIHYWVPSIATCGLLFYTGDKYPEWKNNLFSGALAGMHIARLTLENGEVVNEEKLLVDQGRVRQVAESPDGYIYVLLEGPGQILKLEPVTKSE